MGEAEEEARGTSPGPGTAAVRKLTPSEAATEFETLADNIPTLCWIARPDGHIYWYNRRWYEYTGTSIDTQEGWGWETVHDPAVLPLVMERWRTSLDSGTPFEMTFPLKGADGEFRPFLTRVVPIRGDDGAVARWFGTNTDVESLHQAQAALQLRTAELESLYGSAPIGLAFFTRDHRYVRVNQELARINGMAVEDHLGRTIRELMPANADTLEPIVDQVFATGESRRLEYSGETRSAPGVVRHWLAGFYPVEGSGEAVESVGAWIVEISEQKAAEQRELLLAREVDHRAKNLLAVVQSIVQLTPVVDGPVLKRSIVGRIQALARAHSLLSDARWKGVALDELVRDELAPFGSPDGGRLSFDGPRLLLRPAAAQSLGLVIHELATNAAKYGALSNDSGKVSVQWRRETEEDDALLIEWLESGAPEPNQPDLAGFGSQIIRASVERQLRGKLVRQWTAGGLHCTIRIPAAEVVRGADS